MIGKLTGTPEIESSDAITLSVHDIGYAVTVTPSTVNKLTGKMNATLYIHTNVKDDAIDLYGFMTKKERELFRLLISVSGVGPKTAIKIVDFGVMGITNAVINADVSYFSQIPKVGKKSAQKIIIELKTKLGSLEELDLSESGSESDDLIQTLTSMGFSRHDVVKVLQAIPAEVETIEEKIRYALKHMNR